MKVALVTGASTGIGYEVARKLVDRGFEVYGLARRRDAVAQNTGVRPLAVDLADTSALARAVARIGRVDLLVNSAGYADFAPVELTDPHDAARQLAVNVLAPLELARCVLPGMREQGSGRIVNISSVAARFASPCAGWYHAGKAALEALSDSLRQEVRPHGVDVVIVQPGLVRTGFHDTALDTLQHSTRATPYAGLARGVTAYHRRSAESSMASAAADVAEVVVEASTTPRPRTRYVVGKGSRTSLWVKAGLPDRTFDRMIATQMTE